MINNHEKIRHEKVIDALGRSRKFGKILQSWISDDSQGRLLAFEILYRILKRRNEMGVNPANVGVNFKIKFKWRIEVNIDDLIDFGQLNIFRNGEIFVKLKF